MAILLEKIKQIHPDKDAIVKIGINKKLFIEYKNDSIKTRVYFDSIVEKNEKWEKQIDSSTLNYIINLKPPFFVNLAGEDKLLNIITKDDNYKLLVSRNKETSEILNYSSKVKVDTDFLTELLRFTKYYLKNDRTTGFIGEDCYAITDTMSLVLYNKEIPARLKNKFFSPLLLNNIIKASKMHKLGTEIKLLTKDNDIIGFIGEDYEFIHSNDLIQQKWLGQIQTFINTINKRFKVKWTIGLNKSDLEEVLRTASSIWSIDNDKEIIITNKDEEKVSIKYAKFYGDPINNEFRLNNNILMPHIKNLTNNNIKFSCLCSNSEYSLYLLENDDIKIYVAPMTIE